MTSFEPIAVPPDCLYLTHGGEVNATIQPTPGGDVIAIGFTDPRAGSVRVLLHPEAAKAVAAGIGQVIAHAPYLRAENTRIANELRGTDNG